MEICKHHVNGKCSREKCKFKHVDNICRQYFFKQRCDKANCKFSHEYVVKSNKNTETFDPSFQEPDLRLIINKPITKGNEISIVPNFLQDLSIINKLDEDFEYDTLVSWHGDTHSIADDSLNWKKNAPAFTKIVDSLCEFFEMTPGSTRFNYYKDSKDWKPYHHDAAALKPNKAKTQNITVGISFGLTREISFQSAESDKSVRKTVNIPLENNTVYAFGNEVNIKFRHGIPQLEEEVYKPRISIIVWGYSTYLLK